MADDEAASLSGPASKPEQPSAAVAAGGRGGGWGRWGSLFADLSMAAEEISRNAVATAKGIAESVQSPVDGSAVVAEAGEQSKEEDGEKEMLKLSALDRLEKASEDTLLGQGLKAFDNSVESFASGTWQVLGKALKGGSLLVQQLEKSATSLAETIQHGDLPSKASSFAPSIIETGKTFTARGMEVLERVGKETMELLIEESGMNVEKNQEDVASEDPDEQFEEVSFERCFYIYGGPDQLEELEALSSHYALLFNRKKAKLASDQKYLYEGKLKEIQSLFSLGSETEHGPDSDKGKKVEAVAMEDDAEMKKLCESSVTKAASLAAGFASVLGGLTVSEIIQKTTDRLDAIHSEGVHRLSELCCLAVSQLLTLGKSVISCGNQSTNEETEEAHHVKVDWPEDSVLKAKIIRWKAISLWEDVEKVSSSFLTGISDVLESYLASMRSTSAEKYENIPEHKVVLEKAGALLEHLRADQSSAKGNIQNAAQYLAYVVLTVSITAV